MIMQWKLETTVKASKQSLHYDESEQVEVKLAVYQI